LYSRPILPAGSDFWSGRKATVFALDAGASLGRIDLSMEASRSPAGVIGITAGASTRFERAALQIGLSEIPSGYSVPHGNGMSPFDRPGGRRVGVSIQASPLPALEVDLSLSSTSAIENEGLGEPKTLAEIALRYEAGSGLSLRSVLRLAGSTETGTMQRDGRERFLSIDRSDVAAGLEADLALDRHGSRLRAGIIFRQQNTITSAMSRFTFAELTQTIAETLTVAGRFALFDGEAPVYQFEQLLAGWPRTVALSGRGARFWIRGSGEIWGPARVAAFIARTIYFDRMTISEGTADEIAGDSAAMAGFQIDLRFDL
jgi:hypothetical protein